MALRRCAVALFVLLAGACGEAPPPPPKPPPIEPTPRPLPAPPSSPARWIESGGATLVGPVQAEGTLVLLGGRRALVRPDGSLASERVPAPEPLAELVEIPVASGGGPRLVGRGARAVYRFDDPLGAPVVLAQSAEVLTGLGAGPGLVAVWAGSSALPRFVDVETGREQKLAGLPEPPLRALAFLDARRGAGIFEAVGLAVTVDGGASWRVAGPAEGNARSAGDALRANGLRRRGSELRAFSYADGPSGVVDLAGAHLGALELPRALVTTGGTPASEAPILRWIRATGRDPLEAVASGGLDLPAGGALVASHGLLARVDPAGGAVPELVELARGKAVGSCGAGRAGATAWVACTLADDAGRDLFDPFGVIKVPLGGGPLTPERPAVVRNGEAELRVSPSGGAMLLAPCSNEEMGAACVQQPGGTWKTIAVDGELTERGAGALADGHLAFLRGMFDGDEVADPSPAPPGDDDNAHSHRLHVSLVGPDGKERHLPPIGFTPSRGYARVQSPIEEDADRTLRFVVEDGDGPFAVVIPASKEGAQVHRVPDAVVARLRAGRGVAVGDGRVLASLDGGASWTALPTSPRVAEAATRVAASYEDPGQLVVSEGGARVGSMLRLGWGTPDATSEPPAAPSRDLAGTVLFTPGQPAPSSGQPLLTCTSQGAVAGTPPLEDGSQVGPILGTGTQPARVPPTKPAGTRHEVAAWVPSRSASFDALGAVALLDEEGPDARGSSPARWTLRWFDPQELGGKVRSVSLPAPPGATWGTTLRFVAASGARAVFALRSVGKTRLVRVKASGGPELIEVPSELVPTHDVAFGEGRSDVIAWLRDTEVMVWLPAERPRVIARLGGRATRTLGAPTPAGVPLLLGSSDGSLLRVLPIPPLDRTAAGHAATEPGATPAPAPPSLDGWTRLAPLPADLDGLPVCAPRGAGARFRLPWGSLHADADGASFTARSAVYDVRLGSEACLVGVAAVLAPAGAAKPPAPPPPRPGNSRKPPAPSRDAAFLRVDLAGKRAEGGDRGLPPAAMRRMICSPAKR